MSEEKSALIEETFRRGAYFRAFAEMKLGCPSSMLLLNSRNGSCAWQCIHIGTWYTSIQAMSIIAIATTIIAAPELAVRGEEVKLSLLLLGLYLPPLLS